MGDQLEFVAGSRLTEATKSVLQGSNLNVAVAFWGKGAAEFAGLQGRSDWRAVCNLSMGGTNPNAVREFEDPLKLVNQETVRFREHDRLHAKVYLSDAGAVVASANMSANGLGFEGPELAGWVEAGVYFRQGSAELAGIRKWFESIWSDARPFTDARLKEIKPRYGWRRSSRPSLGTISELDPDDEDFPLFTWWNDEVVDIASNVPPGLRSAIKHGVGIKDDVERAQLREGRWQLWCRMTKADLLDWDTLVWVRIGPVYSDAARSKGAKGFHDVAIKHQNPGPQPFQLTEAVRKKLAALVATRKFQPLRDAGYSGDWYTPVRLGLIQQLWRELKAEER